MKKKKALMVGDLVEWQNLEVLACERVHIGGKKEKYSDAMVRIVRVIESSFGITFDEAMAIGNERRFGFVHSIDGADTIIQDFKANIMRGNLPYIILPSVEMVKVTKKVS